MTVIAGGAPALRTPAAGGSRPAVRPGGDRWSGSPAGMTMPAALGRLSTTDRVSAFEAVMMMRCTAPIVGRRRVTGTGPALRSAPDASGVLNEFNQPAAAYRLVRLLGGLGIDARVERRFDGGRHRYQLYRVIVPPGSGFTVRAILDTAWRSGYLLLCRSLDRSLPRWQQRDRRALAVVAWRAGLMAAGRRRSATLTLRLADPDTTSVLVNGARAMGVHTRAQSRSGYQLLSVCPDSGYERLFAVVGGTEALEDAV